MGYQIATAPRGMVGIPQGVVVALDEAEEAAVVVTLASAGGAFDDASVEVPIGETGPYLRQFTPAAAGAVSVSATNDGGLADPAAKVIKVLPPGAGDSGDARSARRSGAPMMTTPPRAGMPKLPPRRLYRGDGRKGV